MSSTLRQAVLAAAAFVLIAAAPAERAQAALVLDLNTGGSVGTCGVVCSPGSTFGWSFTVTSPFSIDGLGLWDSGAEGIGTSSDVGLWNSNGTLLASTTITDGSTPIASASANGRWLFNSIAPLLLAVDGYRIGAVFSDTLPLAQLSAPFVAIPEISGIVGAGTPSLGTGLQDPSSPFTSLIFGPTMRVAAATLPEPGTLPLVLLVLSGIAVAGGRRKARDTALGGAAS